MALKESNIRYNTGCVKTATFKSNYRTKTGYQLHEFSCFSCVFGEDKLQSLFNWTSSGSMFFRTHISYKIRSLLCTKFAARALVSHVMEHIESNAVRRGSDAASCSLVPFLSVFLCMCV